VTATARPVQPPKLSGHIPALDGVRGLAIILVMFVHLVGDQTAATRGEAIAVKLANYGIWGVDLFFVLSGFLITGILWETKKQEQYFRNFYVRRTLRIFPLYYGVLAALFLAMPLLGPVYPDGLRESAHHQAWLWLYWTNIYVAAKGSWALPYVSHFWSLAVEEHFYLVWPLGVFLCSRRNLLRLCVGVMAFSLALRIALAVAGVNEIAIDVLTPARLDALCIGGFLAIMARAPDGGVESVARLSKPAMYAFAAAVVAVSLFHAQVGRFDAIALPVRGTLIALFFGALIAQSVTRSQTTLVARFFSSAGMRFFGRYSYGLYVFHGIVAYAMQEGAFSAYLANRVNPHLVMPVYALCGAAVSVLIAVLSYHLFEKQLLSLKDRLAPARQAQATASGGGLPAPR
jgi:peptidoglycan/LPS O-acetylase OafA/YrhL